MTNIKRRLYFTMAAALLMVPVISGNVYAAGKAAKAVTQVVSDEKVSLNKGEVKALMQIKGVTAYKAHAIVAYRNKNGGFKSVSELDKVKGFKRMTPESMKAITDHLMID